MTARETIIEIGAGRADVLVYNFLETFKGKILCTILCALVLHSLDSSAGITE